MSLVQEFRDLKKFTATVIGVILLSTASVYAASRIDTAGTSDPSGGKSGPPSLDSLPVLADRDGDGIADGLAAALTAAGSSGTVNVIVLMDTSGSPGKAQDAVGGFKLRQLFPDQRFFRHR